MIVVQKSFRLNPKFQKTILKRLEILFRYPCMCHGGEGVYTYKDVLLLKIQHSFVKYFTNYIYLKYFLKFFPETMCVIIKRGKTTISKTYSPISTSLARKTKRLDKNSILRKISKNFIG